MKKIIIIITVVVLFVVIDIIFESQQKYDCQTLSDMGESAQALEICTLDANNGDARAQYILGWMYKYGQGTSLDYSKAKVFFEKAAEQRHAFSLSELADMYMQGLGVKQDYIQARIYYEVAASQENDQSYSAYDVGYIYENGLGVPIDIDEAKIWYQKSCNDKVFQGCEKMKALSL